MLFSIECWSLTSQWNVGLGYVLSFWFKKEETAQVMTDQLVNLTVFIPWIIMAFVLDEKKLTAENLVSLFPGSEISGNWQPSVCCGFME